MVFKKIAYITLFTLLGILVQFLIGASGEIMFISLLHGSYESIGLGLSLETWYTIRIVWVVALFLAGISVGFWQGMYWWKRLYDDVGIKST